MQSFVSVDQFTSHEDVQKTMTEPKGTTGTQVGFPQIDPVPVLRLRRGRILHRVRILIEQDRVVIRTRCGLDPTRDGFTETIGVPTCPVCDHEGPRS